MPPQFRRAPAQVFVLLGEIFELDCHWFLSLIGLSGLRA
jgi:hypothetical protein